MKISRIIKRLVIIIVLTAIFVASSVVAILLAQGRQLGDNGTVVQTGILRINSIPKEIEAYVNGEKVNLSDNKVEWLQPGKVNLKLVREGYEDWEKEVLIEGGVVKDIYAQLYPKELNFTQIISNNIDKVFYSDDFEYIFYSVKSSKNTNDIGFWKYKITPNFINLTENKPTKFLDLTLDFYNKNLGEDYNLSIARDNTKIILSSKDKAYFGVYDSATLNKEIVLTDLLTNEFPAKFSWFRNSDSIIFENTNILYEYELSSSQSILISYNTTKLPKYFIGNDFVNMIIETSTTNSIMKYKNKVKNQLKLDLLENLTNFNLQSIENIHGAKYNENLIILKKPISLIFMDLDKKYAVESSGVDSILSIAPNTKSILYQNGEDMYTLNFDDSFDNKTYIIEKKNLNIKRSIFDTIGYTSNSKNLVYLNRNTQDVLTINSMDYDGGNKRMIISDERLVNNFPIVSGNNYEMYVLLKEEQELNIFEKYVYKIDLIEGNK